MNIRRQLLTKLFILYSLQGNVADITVTPDLTIEKIKAIVMKHFYAHGTTKMPSQFRLVHSSKFKQLVDGNSVNDEGIREHGNIDLASCLSSDIHVRGK